MRVPLRMTFLIAVLLPFAAVAAGFFDGHL
jgi:hypothetical protein